MMDCDPAHVELYPENSSAKDRYVDVTLFGISAYETEEAG
jgi:hypothetical protein